MIVRQYLDKIYEQDAYVRKNEEYKTKLRELYSELGNVKSEKQVEVRKQIDLLEKDYGEFLNGEIGLYY